jgi:choline/glycine/proline betaine transport protein
MVTFLWMSGFGGSALYLETAGIAEIASAVEADQTTSLFILLDQFPFSIVMSILAIILVLSFFVTSSDSGSLVIDGLTSGGKMHSPVSQRVFWATAEGAVAAILLIGGGLGALQAGAISTGLPFVIVLLFMCYSLQEGLNREYREHLSKSREEERESYRDLVQRLLSKQKKDN